MKNKAKVIIDFGLYIVQIIVSIIILIYATVITVSLLTLNYKYDINILHLIYAVSKNEEP